MAKFFGAVGYAITDEKAPSIYAPVFTERPYKGDVLKITSKWQTADKVNDDISIQNKISIVADPFAIQNFPYIKYVKWLGTAWSVNYVNVEYPRIILTLGGVYNGKQAET